jgi:hypothetical protein
VPGRAGSCNEKPHDTQPAPSEKTDARPWIIRNPSHHAGCGCLCKHCHPDGSDYPYDQALADQIESKRLGTFKIWRCPTDVYIRPVTCNCPCPTHALRPAEVRDESAAPSTAATPESNEAAPATPAINPAPNSTPAHNPESRNTEHATCPLPYDSVAASLKRISQLEAQSRRAALIINANSLASPP